MEDEHAAEPGPREGSMRDGDLEEDERDAGKSQRSTPTTAKTKTRRKAKVIRTIVAAANIKAPWMTKRLMSTPTEMEMPGIADACSPQIAPRNSRLVICAAQPRLHTVPIL
jgi:hypothetical protein